MSINHDSKEVLAKLLAEENLSVVFRNVRTASFSLKDRLLILPVMQNSNQIVNWHVAHEVSHALFTPDEDYIALAKRFGSIPNVVEDVRCNNKICERYVGLNRLRKAAYEEMFDSNFYGNEYKVVDRSNVNELSFIDRINIHFKVGEYAGVQFSQEEMPLVEQVGDVKVWSDVEAACKALSDFLRKQQEEEREEQGSPQPSPDNDSDDSEEDGEEQSSFQMPSFDESDDTEEEEGESDDQDEQESDDGFDDEMSMSEEDESDEGEGDNSSDSDESNEADSDGTDESEDNSEEEGDDADNLSSESSGSEESEEDGEDSESNSANEDGAGGEEEDFEDFFAESETVENEQNAFEDSAVAETEKDLYRTIRDYRTDWKDFIASEAEFKEAISNNASHYKNREGLAMEEFEKANKKTIEDAAQTFLINRKIDYSSPEDVTYSGVIDPNRLHSYKIDDNIFLRETLVKDNSTKHGLMLFVDFSMSMQNRLFGTMQQVINLSMFAREAGIPFEVYGFTWFHRKRIRNTFNGAPDVLNMTWKNCPPVFKMFDDSTSTQDFRQIANDLLFFSKWVNKHRHDVPLQQQESLLYSTPLDTTLHLAKYMGEEFKFNNDIEKLQMVFLTDGWSDDIPNFKTTYKPEGSKYDESSNLHITDPVLRTTKTVKGKGTRMTQMFAENLSEYLEADVLNFFITDDRRYQYSKSRDTEEMVPNAAFNAGSGYGFPETILINDKNFTVESVNINVSSKRSAKSSFNKRGRLSKTTRILMNEFAERIA